MTRRHRVAAEWRPEPVVEVHLLPSPLVAYALFWVNRWWPVRACFNGIVYRREIYYSRTLRPGVQLVKCRYRSEATGRFAHGGWSL